MHMKIPALLALATGQVLAGADVPFTKCISEEEDMLGVKSLKSSNYPFRAGDQITLEVVIEPKEDINGGELNLAVNFRSKELFSKSFDLCTTSGLQCPLKAGEEKTITTTQSIPPAVPALTLQVVINGKDAAGHDLTCLEAELKVQRTDLEDMRTLPAISSSLLADIQMGFEGRRRSWKAHWGPRFSNATLYQAHRMMGTVLRGEHGHLELPPRQQFLSSVQIPKAFDAREQWPSCESIGHVRDQSSCGSCWAMSTTEAFNDRLCIKNGYDGMLSPADTLSCCNGITCGGSMGCDGGQPASAWVHFAQFGVVTGRDYRDIGQGDSCLPYPFVSCAHHTKPTDEFPACPTEDFQTPRCSRRCSEEGYEMEYREDKHTSQDAYSVSGIEKIQRDIMERGPVSAAIVVHQDFLAYKSGVYHHVTGMPLGGHAVKVIGWGSDQGEDYWLVVNSWNNGWGEKGLFRIRRGNDECGIESDITAGQV